MRAELRYARDEVAKLAKETEWQIPHDRYSRGEVERLFRTKAEDARIGELEQELEKIRKKTLARAAKVSVRGEQLAKKLQAAKTETMDKIFGRKVDSVVALRGFREVCAQVAALAEKLREEALRG